jgi:transposase-like protein
MGWLLEPRRRAERALRAVDVESYVQNVSTMKVGNRVQSLDVEHLSKTRSRGSHASSSTKCKPSERGVPR